MKHNPKRVIVPIVIITALFLAGWCVDRIRAASYSTLSGFFESQPAEVASKVGGRVERIEVKEGDAVRAGQIVVELDSSSSRADLLQRIGSSAQARANQSLVDAGPRPEDIAKQEQVVAEMKAQLDEALAGPRPEDIAQARAKLRAAQADYDKALAGPRPEDIAQAQANADAAKARLDAAVRGDTPDQIAQFKDRLDQATSQEVLTLQDLTRYTTLYREDAVTRQQFDTAKADYADAAGKQQEASDAYANALAGTPKQELDEAKYEYQAALQALASLKDGSRPEDIAAAKANRDAAQQALDVLLAGTRPEDIQAAAARAGQAQAQLTELLAGSRPQEKSQAKANSAQAAAAIRSARVNLAEHIIYAPFDGTIDRVLVADGDVVGPGNPVVRIDDPTDIWIRVYVPESMLAHVKTGDSASLKVDGIANPLPAYVDSIASQGEFTPANLQTPDERGKQVFEVRLRLRKPDARVKAGMYATVKALGSVSL